jgi:hypothetical protein
MQKGQFSKDRGLSGNRSAYRCRLCRGRRRDRKGLHDNVVVVRPGHQHDDEEKEKAKERHDDDSTL